MNLIDENEEREHEANKKKVLQYIIIAIIVLVILAVILIAYSVIKQNNTLKLSVDGTSKQIQSGLFYSENGKDIYLDDNNEMYISVKKLSSLLGVDYYNDEYKNKGEDTTKCYIKTENEYTSFISNSNEIYKAIVFEELPELETRDENNNNNNKNKNTESRKTTEYEYFKIQSPVKNIDGEIYASQEAIELGFNIKISYNKSKKDISIVTLDGFSKIAEKVLKNKSVMPVIGDECSYQNKKLLKYGLVLIKNVDNSYGITDYNNYSDGNNIVSCKYSYIRFCESTSNVIVTTLAESKQGVLHIDLNESTAKALIEPNYELIRRIDEDSELYMVKYNGKYGIIELQEGTINTLLRPEYQKIGLDNVYDNMQNEYLINNKYIPIEIDNKWGIASKSGKILITPFYAKVGCDLAETGSGNGVVVLPELVNGIDGIVFMLNSEQKTYGIINVQTGAKIGYEGIDASEIYSVFENNEKVYYMKITLEGKPAMKVNIYNQFGKKVKNSDSSDVNKATNKSTENTNTNSTNGQANTAANNSSTENTVSNSTAANNTTSENKTNNN